ncbi:MAG TPA: hypothetical protein VHT91_24800, partial [Kofleriaceae bacterium]|nr:hypothetical protein [Kofleriaceae bacterium]
MTTAQIAKRRRRCGLRGGGVAPSVGGGSTGIGGTGIHRSRMQRRYLGSPRPARRRATSPDDRIAVARDVELDRVVEPDRAGRRRDRARRQHGVARAEHGELVDRDPAGGAHRDVQADLAGRNAGDLAETLAGDRRIDERCGAIVR